MPAAAVVGHLWQTVGEGRDKDAYLAGTGGSVAWE